MGQRYKIMALAIRHYRYMRQWYKIMALGNIRLQVWDKGAKLWCWAIRHCRWDNDANHSAGQYIITGIWESGTRLWRWSIRHYRYVRQWYRIMTIGSTTLQIYEIMVQDYGPGQYKIKGMRQLYRIRRSAIPDYRYMRQRCKLWCWAIQYRYMRQWYKIMALTIQHYRYMRQWYKIMALNNMTLQVCETMVQDYDARKCDITGIWDNGTRLWCWAIRLKLWDNGT